MRQILTLLCLAFTAANAQSVPAAIDGVLSPLAPAGSPGLAVLVARNGKPVFQRGYGVADLRTFHKIDTRTNFRLASFTKQFTAMAIMLLVNDGKLQYNTSLRKIFPALPSYCDAITIRHLLQHTSGLPDYEELMDAVEKAKGRIWSPTHQIQDDEVLALLQQNSAPKFQAGASWSYSNSGYVVLGLVVAKVSGMPYRDFLARRIFRPLHMTRTVVFENGKNTIANRAYGHSKRAGAFVETDQSSTSATLGDGGIYSNLEDLARWDRALLRHTLLNEARMHDALVPARLDGGSPTSWPAAAGEDNLNPGKPVSYGYGWFLDPYQNEPRMWHSGSTAGFRTIIERFTTSGLTVIVLCNRTDLDATALALKISAVVPR